MSYKKQDFVPKQKLSADHLNNIEDGIVNNENAINEKQDKLVSGTNIAGHCRFLQCGRDEPSDRQSQGKAQRERLGHNQGYIRL